MGATPLVLGHGQWVAGDVFLSGSAAAVDCRLWPATTVVGDGAAAVLGEGGWPERWCWWTAGFAAAEVVGIGWTEKRWWWWWWQAVAHDGGGGLRAEEGGRAAAAAADVARPQRCWRRWVGGTMHAFTQSKNACPKA